jgi:VanZ family protein
MVTLRHLRLPLICGLAVITAVIFYYAVIDDAPLPYHPLVDGWNDIILHIGAFTVLSIVSLMIWRPTMTVFLALLCVGAAIELMQMFVPGREVGLSDMAANAFGLAVGFASYFLLQRSTQRFGCGIANFPNRGPENCDPIGREE